MDELNRHIKQLDKLIGNKISRNVAALMIGETKNRIFTKGLASDNSAIGKYSAGYLKTRIRKGKTASSKVILQFEPRMVNDFSVIESGGKVGLGFTNDTSTDKSFWVENTYGKSIFDHTPGETTRVIKFYNQQTKRILNG